MGTNRVRRQLRKHQNPLKMLPRTPTTMQRSSSFEPQCTHPTMTRVYGPDVVYGTCHRPGPLGWVYQCTHDREDVIDQAVCNGDFTGWDGLGRKLVSNLDLCRKPTTSEYDKFGFLDELTVDKMRQYRPDQIATILRQRDQVQSLIQRDRARQNGTAVLAQDRILDCLPPSPNSYGYRKLWGSSSRDECQYKVCPACRPACLDRSYLSINAVAHGDILPSAAIGFGFHHLGGRPVVDASLIKYIGYRAVPLPTSETFSGTSLFGSGLSLMDILEQQIARGHSLWKHQDDSSQTQPPSVTSPQSKCNTDIVGNLKHSPRCENLDAFVNSTEPSTPALGTQSDTKSPTNANDATPDDHCHSLAEYGLSPCKRLSNSQPRCHSSSNFDYCPSFPQFTASAHDAASTLSLSDSAQFKPEPLRLDHGVAMLEESVQLGVPDIITHA